MKCLDKYEKTSNSSLDLCSSECKAINVEYVKRFNGKSMILIVIKSVKFDNLGFSMGKK